MRRRKLSPGELPFLARVEEMEQRLFGMEVTIDHPSDTTRHGRRFWHFRPSHHIASGLVTEEDIKILSQPGKRLLSVGACPGHLEQILVELGVPSENIVIADQDPTILQCEVSLQKFVFDATEPWPAIGTFDRILFPESLCIAIGDRVNSEDAAMHPSLHASPSESLGAHRTDPLEAKILAHILGSALHHLRPGGILRANGPMSHPKVLRDAIATLRAEGHACEVEARRFFLSCRWRE